MFNYQRYSSYALGILGYSPQIPSWQKCPPQNRRGAGNTGRMLAQALWATLTRPYNTPLTTLIIMTEF